jgi:pyrroloquinoline quinone (PQQ) biosynthesis protein C
MGSTPATNLVYDLVSVQYHALKGGQLAEQFLRDAEGDDEARAFFEQVKQQDAERAERCHELIAKLTSSTSLEAYPDEPTKAKQGASTG